MSSSRNDCEYKTKEINSTLENIQTLAMSEECPHIRLAEPSPDGVQILGIMDSACYKRQQKLDNNLCEKGDNDWLRLVGRLKVSSRHKRDYQVSVSLKSSKPEVLQFFDPKSKQLKVVLDLKDSPISIKPVYTKVGSVNFDTLYVQVKKYPKEQDDWVHLEIEATITKKNSPKRLVNPKCTLQIVVPSLNGKNEEEDAMLDPFTTSVITTTLGLMIKDGYKWIKNKALAQDGSAKPTKLCIGENQIDLEGKELNHYPFFKNLQATIQETLKSELETKVDVYKTLCKKRDLHEKSIHKQAPGSNRIQTEFEFGEVKDEINKIATEIFTILERILGVPIIIE